MTLQLPIDFCARQNQELSFFNTIHLSGSDLMEATKQTGLQNSRVLEIFKSGKNLTPFDVHDIYERSYPPVPYTSIRRSVTVLTKKGLLEKTEEMKVERFGMKNHMWRIKNCG